MSSGRISGRHPPHSGDEWALRAIRNGTNGGVPVMRPGRAWSLRASRPRGPAGSRSPPDRPGWSSSARSVPAGWRRHHSRRRAHRSASSNRSAHPASADSNTSTRAREVGVGQVEGRVDLVVVGGVAPDDLDVGDLRALRCRVVEAIADIEREHVSRPTEASGRRRTPTRSRASRTGGSRPSPSTHVRDGLQSLGDPGLRIGVVLELAGEVATVGGQVEVTVARTGR